MKLAFFSALPLCLSAATSASSPGTRSVRRRGDAAQFDADGIFGEGKTFGSFAGIPPASEWTPAKQQEVDDLLADLDAHLKNNTKTGTLIKAALASLCNPLFGNTTKCELWRDYRDGEKPVTDFFRAWLKYTPIPPYDDGNTPSQYEREISGPGYYILRWDTLSFTEPGKELTFNDTVWHTWMVKFLNLHGDYLDSTSSLDEYPDADFGPLQVWQSYKAGGDHPFDWDLHVVPEGGYQSYNQVFLRELKPGYRPLGGKENGKSIASPCDGSTFFLTLNDEGDHNQVELPGKSGDTFGLVEAIPGYGNAFRGGVALDFLLWFTDYHHFHAPVSGKVIYVEEFDGVHNDGYGFDGFTGYDDSKIKYWWETLDKHRRTSIVFDAGEDIGLVGMVPVGFWGVGSMEIYIKEGDEVTQGDHIGHFLNGGSSIVLVFEPLKDFSFVIKGTAVGTAHFKRLVNVKEQIGELVMD